jgi:hypothetical protein
MRSDSKREILSVRKDVSKGAFVVPLVTLALASNAASAAVLVQYDFESATPAVASATDTGVTATSLAASGFTPTQLTSGGAANSKAWPVNFSLIDNDFGTDDYYGFTLTPTAGGASLDLTDLTFFFNISPTSSQHAASMNSRYQLRYDDLSSVAATYVTVGTAGPATSNGTFTADFDLGGVAFDQLASGIRFQLDVADNGSGTSGHNVRLDNLTVNGEVIAVPEPATAAMAVLCSGLLLGRSRSRRSSLLVGRRAENPLSTVT